MTVGDVYDLAPGLPATTEFGRSDTEFALPYQIAISMLTTKVRTLKQEFTRRDGYCPIEAVSSRVKTHASIVAKAQRLCCPLTADDIRNADELLGVGRREAQDRRLAQLAQQRWESDGGALRRLSHQRGSGAAAAEVQGVRDAQ